MTPARAIPVTEPVVRTPARAETITAPVLPTPARAVTGSVPMLQTPARAERETTPKQASPARDLLLEQIRLLGRTLDDLERMRVMGGNRVAAFERELGLTIDYHDVIQKQLRVAEHIAELELKRAWRKHPLAPWAKGIRGVGEKSIARLIAEVGDPAERPNPGKLLAYCGHGEALRRHRKGMSQDELFRCGNPRAKKQVFLIATAMLKSGNRNVYDARRIVTADRGWTLGHAHADALRIVGKEFLKELWNTARAGQPLYGAQLLNARAGHSPNDPQELPARAGDPA